MQTGSGRTGCAIYWRKWKNLPNRDFRGDCTKYNAEGRPIWKPMHMQTILSDEWFCYQRRKRQSRDKCLYRRGTEDVGMDIFSRGYRCLPSDNKMTAEQQEKIIEVIRSCFGERKGNL